MFGSYVKLKVEKETWEQVRRVCGKDNDDRDIGQEVLETYLRSKELVEENKELKRVRDKNSNTIQALRKSLDEICEEYGGIEKELASARSNYSNLKRDYEALRGNPVIEERIVYKEDKATIEALRKKRDQLQKELWRVRNERDRIYQEGKQARNKIDKLERMKSDWKRRNHAILVMGKVGAPPDAIKDIEVEMVDSKS